LVLVLDGCLFGWLGCCGERDSLVIYSVFGMDEGWDLWINGKKLYSCPLRILPVLGRPGRWLLALLPPPWGPPRRNFAACKDF
jgi:hypothetical protein